MACWVTYTQRLVGHKIMDIVIDEGTTVWIFDNHLTLPLKGWVGNEKASSSPAEAEALLEVMAGTKLLEARWDQEEGRGHLIVGDFTLGDVAPWWGVILNGLEG